MKEFHWSREDYESDLARYEAFAEQYAAAGLSDEHPLVSTNRRRITTCERVLRDFDQVEESDDRDTNATITDQATSS